MLKDPPGAHAVEKRVDLFSRPLVKTSLEFVIGGNEQYTR